MRMTPWRARRRKGYFSTRARKETGWKVTSKVGKSEDFRITNNDGGGATALLHCEEATKDF